MYVCGEVGDSHIISQVLLEHNYMSWEVDRDKGREVDRGNVMVVLPTVDEEMTSPWLATCLTGQNHY